MDKSMDKSAPVDVKSNWLASWLAKFIEVNGSTSNRWTSQWASQAPPWRQILLTCRLTCKFHQGGWAKRTLTAKFDGPVKHMWYVQSCCIWCFQIDEVRPRGLPTTLGPQLAIKGASWRKASNTTNTVGEDHVYKQQVLRFSSCMYVSTSSPVITIIICIFCETQTVRQQPREKPTYQVSSNRLQTSTIKYQISNTYQLSDISWQTSDIEYQTIHVDHQLSQTKYETSNSTYI